MPGLEWRDVTVLRAIARYLRQARTAFSDRYMEQALMAHPRVAAALVELFHARFDPGRDRSPEAADAIAREIEEAIDAVESLDEDRILRNFLAVVRAMLRTNHFQPDAGGPKPYLSFKLDPERVPLLPAPRPRFEIFVHSPRVEGVHLRGGAVARGGLRWSDRREDFRTEVLGLMKAQMVKNALIVPVGAKGGFVVKRPPPDREALGDEVVACYRTFISGLLDLTDTVREGRVTPPPDVVRHDGDDPYLVVAADKGTATFSDIANGIAQEYGFWLGDAFASGGSVGYDHKAMGITARSAWESVKRHFRELGTDIQASDFTVVGIGDMSGDVFGNGMLLSPHIKLDRRLRPPSRVPRPGPRSGGQLGRAPAAVRAAALLLGGLRPLTDLFGRRRVAAQRQVDHRVGRGAAGAGDRVRPAHARRAHPRAAARPGRPAVERRDRDVRQGDARRTTPTSATRPTTRSASTRASCAAAWWGRAATWG